MKLYPKIITLVVSIILLIVSGVVFFSRITEEKTYETAKKEDTISGYRDYLNKYPDKHHSKEVTELLAVKVYNEKVNKESYLALNAFIEEFPDSAQAQDARLRAEGYVKQYKENSKLSGYIAKMTEFMETGNIEESIDIATTILDQCPELFTHFDFIQADYIKILCYSINHVGSLKEERPLKDKMFTMRIFNDLSVLFYRCNQIELAKAAKLRAFLEIFPYYYSDSSIFLAQKIMNLSKSFGTTMFYGDYIYLPRLLKNKFISDLKNLDKKKLFSSFQELLDIKTEDQLRTFLKKQTDGTSAEGEVFIAKVFGSALEMESDQDNLMEIFRKYPHPSVLNFTVAQMSDFFDYRLADVVSGLDERIHPELMRLLDSENDAVRINTILALAWTEKEDAFIKKLNSMLVASPDTNAEKIQNMVIMFTIGRWDDTSSIEILVNDALSSDYELCSHALSLLRYTKRNISADQALAICEHICSGEVINPRIKTLSSQDQIKARLSNRIYKSLGQIVQNAEYSEKLGRLIFEQACKAYDGGEGDEIRQEWFEAAQIHGEALSSIAFEKLESEAIMESSLAIRLLLAQKTKDLDENRVRNIVNTWEQNKEAYFKPFVEIEVKGELADTERTTSYPSYVPYGRIYRQLTNAYYEETLLKTNSQIASSFKMSEAEKLDKLKSKENFSLIVLLSLDQVSPEFVSEIEKLFKATSPSEEKDGYAAILAQNGNIEAFEYLLSITREDTRNDGVSRYFSFLLLNDEQLKILGNELDRRKEQFDTLPKLVKDDSMEYRHEIEKSYIPQFYWYYVLSDFYNKHRHI